MKKICFITSSRADYGLLKNVMRRVDEVDQFALQVAVTGGHLERRYGHTVDQIEEDGFEITARVSLSMSADDPPAIVDTMASAMTGFAAAFAEMKPDMVFVLGDRHEILAATLAAFISGIPIAHHSGGDVTTGAYDDAMRHCITKSAQYHFVSCEASRRRVLQMGEDSNRVFLVGGLGIENMLNQPFLSRQELQRDLDFTFAAKNLLLTFHPETMSPLLPEAQIRNLLSALNRFPNIGLIITAPNHDKGSFQIVEEIEQFVEQRENACFVTSLGELRYHSVARLVDGVVGNSSSGICEIPSLKTGVVNIGDRQNGREQASCIINCENDDTAIAEAIEKLFAPSFLQQINDTINPYDHGLASASIVNILRKVPIEPKSNKGFVDLVVV